MKRIPGYCALCRRKEMELYGTIVNNAGKRHQRACREAGCKHPASYQDVFDAVAQDLSKVKLLPPEDNS